jgi:hypothetical protein
MSNPEIGRFKEMTIDQVLAAMDDTFTLVIGFPKGEPDYPHVLARFARTTENVDDIPASFMAGSLVLNYLEQMKRASETTEADVASAIKEAIAKAQEGGLH